MANSVEKDTLSSGKKGARNPRPTTTPKPPKEAVTDFRKMLD